MAGILTEKSRAEREQRVRAVVAKLAHEVPELANLDPPADKEAIRLGPGPPGSLVRKAGYFPAGTQSCPGRRLD